MIKMFLEVSPYITFKHTDLKRAVTNCALEYSGLYDHKTSRKPVDRWASDVAERMMCVLTHVRRVANSPVRFQQATSNLTTADVAIVRQLTDQVQLDENPRAAAAAASVKTATPTASAIDPAEPVNKKRALQREEGLMSVDSDGLPNLMKLWGTSGMPAAPSKPKQAADVETTYYDPVPPTKRLLKMAHAKDDETEESSCKHSSLAQERSPSPSLVVLKKAVKPSKKDKSPSKAAKQSKKDKTSKAVKQSEKDKTSKAVKQSKKDKTSKAVKPSKKVTSKAAKQSKKDKTSKAVKPSKKVTSKATKQSKKDKSPKAVKQSKKDVTSKAVKPRKIGMVTRGNECA